MSDTTETTRMRVPLWVKLLLGLSLALNLAVIGLVVGVVSRLQDRAPAGGVVGYPVPYVLSLKRDDRRDLMRKVRSETAAGPRANRQLHRDMMAVLGNDVWDESAARGIFEAQRKNGNSFLSVFEREWLALVGRMSDEERAEYLLHLTETVRRAPRVGPPKRD